jgi:hypothetical protein
MGYAFEVENRDWRKPCVYEFLREGVVTYVGRSCVGISGAFRHYTNGHNPGRAKAWKEADKIVVVAFDTLFLAKECEIKLIRQYSPEGNIHFNPCIARDKFEARAAERLARTGSRYGKRGIGRLPAELDPVLT